MALPWNARQAMSDGPPRFAPFTAAKSNGENRAKSSFNSSRVRMTCTTRCFHGRRPAPSRKHSHLHLSPRAASTIHEGTRHNPWVSLMICSTVVFALVLKFSKPVCRRPWSVFWVKDGKITVRANSASRFESRLQRISGGRVIRFSRAIS